jgi:hypothetical protein
VGRRHHGLNEDDDVVGPVTVWVNGVVGSGMARGAQHHMLRDDDSVVGSRTASRAWGRRMCGRWHHRLGSGKMVM